MLKNHSLLVVGSPTCDSLDVNRGRTRGKEICTYQVCWQLPRERVSERNHIVSYYTV
jgi:hypothetical protein